MPIREEKLPDGRTRVIATRDLDEHPETRLDPSRPYVPVDRVDFLIYSWPPLPPERVSLWRRVVRWVHDATEGI